MRGEFEQQPFGGVGHAEPVEAPEPLVIEPPPWSGDESFDPAELDVEPLEVPRVEIPPPDWPGELGLAVEDEQTYPARPRRKDRP
jgi:hypothetical protein